MKKQKIAASILLFFVGISIIYFIKIKEPAVNKQLDIHLELVQDLYNMMGPGQDATIVNKQLDIHSELVQDLYNMMNPSQDATILKGLYENEELSNDYILAVGISNYIKDQEEPPKYINKIDIERTIHQIFGYGISFSHNNTLILNGDVCKYDYLPKLEKYELVGGCGGNFYESFDRVIISAKQIDDQILIEEKLIYIYDDWDDYVSRKYVYNDYNRENVLDYLETSSTDTTKVDINNYLEQASIYQYQFQKHENTYQFRKIIKVK